MTMLEDFLKDLAPLVNLDCGTANTAGVTRAAFARLIRQAIGNLENSLRGLPPQFSVNGLSSIRPSA